MESHELLKKYRLAAGITQVELAKLLDTHQPVISNYENGRSTPSAGDLKKIAEVLKLNQAEAQNLADPMSLASNAQAGTPAEERTLSSWEMSKELNTQILDLKNSVSTLSEKINVGVTPNHELTSAISDMQTAILDLQKTGQEITAPVALPTREQLQVKLISTVSFERLEEYRSGENKWSAFGCLFAGAVIGILINLVTGSTATSETWLVGGVLLVMGILCFTSGFNYSRKAKTLTSKLVG